MLMNLNGAHLSVLFDVLTRVACMGHVAEWLVIKLHVDASKLNMIDRSNAEEIDLLKI